MTFMSDIGRRSRRMAGRGGGELSERIAALQDTLQDLTESMEEMARDSARAARRRARGGFDGAHDALEEGVLEARKLAADTARRGRRMVEEHPAPVAAAAVGVIGLIVLGYLWERGMFRSGEPRGSRGGGGGS